MSAWQSLGNMLGGGIDREGAYQEGMQVGAQTQSALAQARVRQMDAVKKRDEYEQGQNLAQALLDMDIAPDAAAAQGMETLLRSGRGNFQQMQSGRQTGQSMAFREEMADPNTDFSRAQRLRMADGQSAFNSASVQGGLAFDLLSPDPYGSAQVTPGEQASIHQRTQAGNLSQARYEDPERFRSNTTFQIGGPGGLASQITDLPTGIDDSIDFGQGFGVEPAVARLANIISGLIPGKEMPYEDRERAINAVEDLQNRVILSAKSMTNQRMSDQLMDMMRSFTVDPASLIRGEERAFTRLMQTRDFMRTMRQELEVQLQQGGTTSQRFNIEGDYIKLYNLERAHTQVLEQMQQARAQRRPGVQTAPPSPDGWVIEQVEE